MSKVNVNELTDSQKKRLSQLKERDTIAELIVEGMYNRSEIDFDVISAIEKRTFKKQDYYVAAEVLFNTGASVEWINIVLNVITARGEDEIISFIREVVYAYNCHVEAESIAQFIDACDTPVELHAFTDDIIHQKESTNKVREVIEKIPDLIGKIETDSFEAKQNYVDMKNELDSKISEVDDLKNQIKALQEESKNNSTNEEFAKLEKKANFIEKKFKESQKELRVYKDKCVHLEARLEEYKSKLDETEKSTDAFANSDIADELKRFLAEKFDASVDSIAKTVSNSYSQVLNVVKRDNKSEIDENDAGELKKIISQNENIMEKLQSISSEAVVSSQKNNKDVSQQHDILQPHHQPDPIEERIKTNESSDVSDYEISEDDMMGDISGEMPDIVYEEPAVAVPENVSDTDTDEEDVTKSVDNTASDSKAETVIESEIDHTENKSVAEPDPTICKATDLTANKILSSKVGDDKQEKKIGFFARMRFKHLKDKKQKQLILDLMLHKKLSMNVISDVKNLLESGKVDNNFVFDLINDDELNDDVIKKALAFVS